MAPRDPAIVIQVATAASAKGINPSVALAIANKESNLDPNSPNSPKGAVGVMQLEPSSFPNLTIDQLRDPSVNIPTGVNYFGDLLNQYNGNYTDALAAYNWGPGKVNDAIAKYGPDWWAIDPEVPDETENYVSAILPVAAGQSPWTNTNAGAAAAAAAAAGAPGGVTSSPTNSINNTDVAGTIGRLPISPAAQPGTTWAPVKYDAPTVTTQDLFPDAIITTGLDEVPWYSDKNLLTGNPKVRNSVTPVVFEVVLRDRDDIVLSSSPANNSSPQGVPIQIQLNASMKTFSVSSKHVFNPKRTRTGWHITMWGMQADTIEGSCTTGVFMNQLGITDFFSTSQANSEIIELVTSGFESLSAGEEVVPNLAVGQGQAVAVQTSNVVQSDVDLFNQRFQVRGQGVQDTREAFRVAAQDAFVEFLSLFKNNGVVWFWNKGYEQTVGSTREQVNIDEWSPQLGASVTNKNSRNNDVMTRGSVLMKFKGTTYVGYFKSLSWNMDAASPFQWTFNFVFQVEKTLGYIFSPTG